MGIDLYEILGVDKKSTADEIKNAYKMKAKENHPDKEGGSHEKMTDIVRAYGVLGKEGSRKRYDDTGEESDVGFEVKFQELVNFAFLKIVDENDIERVDLVKELDKYIKFVARENNKTKNELLDKEAKLTKVKNKLSAKGDNRIGKILDMNLHDIKRQIIGIEDYMTFLKECTEVVNHHSYEFNPEPQEQVHYFINY
jgi:curved DNA-binding protein CbpA